MTDNPGAIAQILVFFILSAMTTPAAMMRISTPSATWHPAHSEAMIPAKARTLSTYPPKPDTLSITEFPMAVPNIS